jgi:hypothetical protein
MFHIGAHNFYDIFKESVELLHHQQEILSINLKTK